MTDITQNGQRLLSHVLSNFVFKHKEQGSNFIFSIPNSIKHFILALKKHPLILDQENTLLFSVTLDYFLIKISLTFLADVNSAVELPNKDYILIVNNYYMQRFQ